MRVVSCANRLGINGVDTKVNYTVVGLFVVLLTGAFIAMFFWLSTLRHDKVYKTYLLYVHEDVSGLSAQSTVRFNGVPVGSVKAIELDPQNPKLVRISLQIQEGTPITTATYATLKVQGITGVLNVGLKAVSVDAPLLKAKPGQKYPVIPSRPSLLVQLSEVLPQITKNVQNVGESISKVLSEKNREAISVTLQNMEGFTRTLSNNSKELDRSIKALDETLQRTSLASEKLPKVMDDLEAALNGVKQASATFDTASRSLRKTMDVSRDTLTNVSDQLLPSAQLMLNRINQVSANLQQFSGELSRNPTILIRGKQPTPPGPGEK